jgi:hypothetical protein
MSGRKHCCDCGNLASHKTGAGWECDRCKELNALVVHPQDYPQRWMDTEEWQESRRHRLERQRIYNRTVRVR